MDKLKMHSPNLTQDNIARIAKMFPGCVTETRGDDGSVTLAVDFDQLKQELSESITEGPQERYHLNWPGKREALLAANAPIAKTLRPNVKESLHFGETRNLFIEGDNLDGLKLLQESYLGKIKMIYIDPPYNTGDDFIYEDDFAENTSAYLARSNQRDEAGARLTLNSDSSGRYHSDWLSMMYSRLKLARNLLRDDGLIFISIGDEEVANLRNICDEIFGRDNFEGHIHWRRRSNQPNDPTKMIGLVAEHILVYAKDKWIYKAAGVGKVELTGAFSNPDNDPRGDWASKPWKVGSDQSGSRYTIITPTGNRLDDEWMGEEATYKKLLEDNRIIFPNNGNGSPRKKYFKFEREEEGQCATNWWSHEQFGHNQEGNSVLTELMDGIKNTFSNPKPPKLIRNLMAIANCKEGDVVLDFFLGSGSTFHAAFEYGKNLKLIGIQIPEPLDGSKKEHKPAVDFLSKNNLPLTIAEISKERIRRAGKAAHQAAGGVVDFGFRVLKIDSSNLADVYYRPDEIEKGQLDLMVDNIKSDRTPEDLLFQVMLDWGVDLALPIAKETIQGKDVFFADGNALAACFDARSGIDEAFVKELAKRQPLRVVFRDAGFKDSAVKINVEQIFKLMSPATEVKCI
ncbi:MAG: site-specific DNA-methyltransferase [Comamonas sp.]|uniref:site-specific DNA-methyltransferase n=1 Tax=Comamonas sp. TaxID=34028 RepID=UPI002830C8BF|nr:site-specific DNA-methyltransferase [Comamonas sp.]MDR0212822.1 site-specific DNA-methyltransferase [Comamonas sp.]